MNTHLSKYCLVQLVGRSLRLPTEIHATYCGLKVKPSEIDNEKPTCEECQDWLTWNEIDGMDRNN